MHGSGAIRRGVRLHALVMTAIVSGCNTPFWDRGRAAARPYDPQFLVCFIVQARPAWNKLIREELVELCPRFVGIADDVDLDLAIDKILLHLLDLIFHVLWHRVGKIEQPNAVVL